MITHGPAKLSAAGTSTFARQCWVGLARRFTSEKKQATRLPRQFRKTLRLFTAVWQGICGNVHRLNTMYAAAGSPGQHLRWDIVVIVLFSLVSYQWVMSTRL